MKPLPPVKPAGSSKRDEFYELAATEQEVEDLAERAAAERARFIAHAAGYIAAVGIGGVVALAGTLAGEGDLLGLAILGGLGWGIGVATHGAWALFTLPRTVEVHRRLLPLSSRPDSRDSLAEEIARSAGEAGARLKRLDPPRVDLEVELEHAAKEAERLQERLKEVESALRRPATRRAEPDRMRALAEERSRLRLALERLRLTVSNIEVDTLLIGSLSGSSTAFESLETEAELLRAAVEGAQRARTAIAAS